MRFVLSLLALLLAGPAFAQCGPSSCLVPTRPPGDSTNAAASTAFVTNAVSTITAGTQWFIRPVVTQSPYLAVGDGVTNNTSAFAAMEASSSKGFFLADGSYLLTNLLSTTKMYTMFGEMTDGTPTCTSCNAAAGVWSHITTMPANTQSNSQGGNPPFIFQGDTTHVFPEYFLLENVRNSFTSAYVNSVTTPHTRWFDQRSGSSGTITVLTSGASIGNTVLNVLSNAGIVNGQQYGFTDENLSHPFTDIFTVVSSTPTTITITPALTHNYLAGGPPFYVTGATAFIANSYRQNNSLSVDYLVNRGAGDSYVHFAIIQDGYTPLAGQTTIGTTTTVGYAGGELLASQPGGTLNMFNWQYLDNGNDIAVLGNVEQYNRTNNTGARNAFWIGDLQQSIGTVPSDAAYEINGLWNVGLDTVTATFTPSGGTYKNVAINMAPNQKIVFDSASVATDLPPLWGRTIGTSYIYFNSTDSAIEIVAGGANVVKFSGTGSAFFTTGVSCTAGTVNIATIAVVGGVVTHC